MKTYTDIFWDWDHTIWDFETNSRLSLQNLFEDLGLGELGLPDFDTWFERYLVINEEKWEDYRHGRITKEVLRTTRFSESFGYYGVVADELAQELEQRYVAETPYQKNLLPGAREIIEYLHKKGYSQHIITNGFSESQHIKFRSSGLEKFFDQKICSDVVGVNKPDPKIFRYAISHAKANRKTSLMIGDGLIADVVGAQAEGIDAVFYNPKGEKHTEKPYLEIAELLELKKYL
ncbi:MAG: hypothetical protein RL754_19 [Bacteroidota bacterium]|jgi:putative hydrolase of the HAD superfamily